MAEETINRTSHCRYLERNLSILPGGHKLQSQDSSHCSIVWFTVLGLLLLDETKRLQKYSKALVKYLESIESNRKDGFLPSPTHCQRNSGASDTFCLTSTLFGLFIAQAMPDYKHSLDLRQLAANVRNCQLENGSVHSNTNTPGFGGEISLRHAFSAMAILKILDKRDANFESKLVKYVLSTQTWDGGFSETPKGESHAGLTYCAIGILAMCEKINNIKDRGALLRYLAHRQNEDGGFNGRENKDSDSCYAFWVTASLAMLNEPQMYHKPKACQFLLEECQCEITGGFSKYPDEYPDPLHTTLSIAALSIVADTPIVPLDPVYCVPQSFFHEGLARRMSSS